MKACGFVFALIALTAGTSFAAEDAVLRAGVATAVITPPLDDRPVGVTGDRLEGVTHDIYARALVLDDGTHKLATVTYDLNCLDVATPLLRVRLRDELGIGPAYFIPLATHNHCAPIQIVPDNFAYGRWLADRSFELIEEAIAGLRGPVRLRFGGGYCYHIRSLGNAPVDYEVQVLAVTEGDTPLAILFNYPTHPLQVEYSKVGFGHVGYAVEALEAQFPGAVAMYADACGGNQFTQRGMNAPLDVVQAFAGELADVVAGVMRGEMRDVTGPLSSEREVIDLPLADPMPYEDAKKLAVHFPQDIGFVPYPHPDRETNWIRSLMEHYEKDIPFPKKTTDRVCTDDGFLVQELPEAREFPCRYEETIVARLGELIFVAMQGEVCAPIGMRIKDAFRYEHPIMVFAYMGEHNLYIPTRELVRLNLYQAQVIQIQYASPVRWAPTVEGAMVGAVTRMVRNTLR